jgi:sugar/nucleoside kinase (ribokinase family)
VSRLDVVGIGNALVDVLSHEDEFIATGSKGAMALIDAERAEQLYGLMGPGAEISGGSAANSMVGHHSECVSVHRRVNDDQLSGVRATSAPQVSDIARVRQRTTRRCLIVGHPRRPRVEHVPRRIGVARALRLDIRIIRAQVLFLEGTLGRPG